MIETIRSATLDDADALAALHAASWRSAYRGILSDATLGAGLDDERRAHWRTALSESSGSDIILIADGVGFIAVWAEGDPGFGAYLDNLHVDPEHRGSGVGRLLLGAAARQLAERGERRVYLWVFEDNPRAIAFYRRLGGEVVERGVEIFDGREVAQSRLVWSDTRRLAEACGA
jgi:ribosomal protein S18 acetylase RimI-like enzyme